MFNKKHIILRMSSVAILLIIIIYPILLYANKSSAGLTYLITSLIYALPVVSAIMCVRQHWLWNALVFLLCLLSMIDMGMILMFDNYINASNILAIITTTTEESTHFIHDSLHYLWYGLPYLLFFGVAIILHEQSNFSLRSATLGLGVSLLLMFGFVTAKLQYSYQDKLTLRYFMDNRILNRPPYNVPYQIACAGKLHAQRKYIEEATHMSFSASQFISEDSIPSIYVLAIGESCNYEHFSMNGTYSRETTPRLSAIENITLFRDYYSTGCLTMWSVPQIVTRATPYEYDLNFREKSIIKPFAECGYKTFVISFCGNLLAYETYLSDGCDSLIVVNTDMTIVNIVDSLSHMHNKLFIIVEFLGNHHPYYNYTEDFDVFHPNINSEPNADSDSLYINAYDNTILYADYILSTLIENLKKKNANGAFLFVSDHGEGVSKNGGGHGGNCAPTKIEYHVPMLVWCSDEWIDSHPVKYQTMLSHKNRPVNSDNIFYTMCGLADIELGEAYRVDSLDITNSNLKDHPRFVLVPDGKNVVKVE